MQKATSRRAIALLSGLLVFGLSSGVAQSKLRGRIVLADRGVGAGWQVEAFGSAGTTRRAIAKKNGFFSLDVGPGQTWILWAYERQEGALSRVTDVSRPLRPGRSIELREARRPQARVAVRVVGDNAWRAHGPLRFEMLVRLDSDRVLRRPIAVDVAATKRAGATVLTIPRVPTSTAHVVAVSNERVTLPSLRISSPLGADAKPQRLDYRLLKPVATELEVRIDYAPAKGVRLLVLDGVRRDHVSPQEQFLGTTDDNGRLRAVFPSLAVVPRAFRLDLPDACLESARPRRTNAAATSYRLEFSSKRRHYAVLDPKGLDAIELVSKGSTGRSRTLRSARVDREPFTAIGIPKGAIVEHWGRIAETRLAASGDMHPIASWALLSDADVPYDPRPRAPRPVTHALEDLYGVDFEVVADDGNAAHCPRVYFESSVGTVRAFTASARGRLRMLVSKDAEWKAWAVWPGGVTDVVTSRDVERQVTLRGHQRLKIHGRVVDAGGAPVAGAQVQAHPKFRFTNHLKSNQLRVAQTIETDERGEFTLSIPFPSLEWTLRASSRIGRSMYAAAYSATGEELARRATKLELRANANLFPGANRRGIRNPLIGGTKFR